jgi:hypothetical protein
VARGPVSAKIAVSKVMLYKLRGLGRVCKGLQPEQDHVDMDHRAIVVGTLFVPGGDAPGLLEAVDQLFESISLRCCASACRSDRMRCQIPALCQR